MQLVESLHLVHTLSTPQRLVWNATLTDGMASFFIRQGDTGRPLAVLLKNQDGSDAVIPVASTCVFKMTQRQTGHVVTGAAALSGANLNIATYPFSNALDTAQPGIYDAVWLVTYPAAGGVETFPTNGRGVNGYTVEVAAIAPDRP